MDYKSLLVAMLLFASVPCFAQNQNTSGGTKTDESTAKKPEISVTQPTSLQDKQESKAPDLKSAPAVFFIINDKPVSREEYMHHLLRLEEEKKKKND